jgi:hypothetical protein
MARCNKESLQDDEIMQELRADLLSDIQSDCESDKRSNDDDGGDDLVTSTSQKGRKRARLEVSDSDVNTYDDDEVGDGLTKNDDLRNLEQVLSITDLIFTPSDLPIYLK